MSVVMRTSHRIERINYLLTNRNKKQQLHSQHSVVRRGSSNKQIVEHLQPGSITVQ